MGFFWSCEFWTGSCFFEYTFGSASIRQVWATLPTCGRQWYENLHRCFSDLLSVAFSYLIEMLVTFSSICSALIHLASDRMCITLMCIAALCIYCGYREARKNIPVRVKLWPALKIGQRRYRCFKKCKQFTRPLIVSTFHTHASENTESWKPLLSCHLRGGAGGSAATRRRRTESSLVDALRKILSDFSKCESEKPSDTSQDEPANWNFWLLEL